MMFLGRFVCLVLAAAVMFVGCAKKKVEQPAPAAVADSTKDSADVFNEFFQEDKKVAAQPAASSYTPEFAEDGRYVVQVSCVGSQKLAEDVVATLQGKGWPAYTAEVQSPTPELAGTYYRVRVGGFYGVSAARAFGENALVPAGYDFWVDNKSNDNVGISSGGLGASTPSSSDYGTSSYSSTTTTTEPSTAPATTTTEGTWGSSASTTGTTSTGTTDWGSSSSTSGTSTGTTTTGGTESTSGTSTSTSGGTGSTGGSTTGGGIGDNWGSDW